MIDDCKALRLNALDDMPPRCAALNVDAHLRKLDWWHTHYYNTIKSALTPSQSQPCDNHQNVDPDILKWEDGDEVEIVCKNCEYKYIARGYTTVDYSADEIDEELEKYLEEPMKSTEPQEGE